MKSIVVYRSKSGNTKAIAELMASKLGTKALSVNLFEKKGRGTKEEQQKEKDMFVAALEACKGADLVIVGTPVSFQQAHSQITRFCKQVEAKKVGLFCTYINKMGTTFADIESVLKERGINVVGSADFGNLNSGQFETLDKPTRDDYIKKAEKFVERCFELVKESK